ncbi:MAG: hypothetical protein ABEJ61_07395 [Haloferacaceae archaeon]
MTAPPGRPRAPEYGTAWVYESIVGAVPGANLTGGRGVLVQFVLFETSVLALAWAYGLPDAAVAGTVAVAVAAAGSVGVLRVGRTVRAVDPPETYRRLLFGSSIEVVLAVVAFAGLVTYLFVVDPASPPGSLLASLFGPDPPAPAVFLALLVLWDLCYRIGVSWWAAVVALWRSRRLRFEAGAARTLRRADATNVAFALTQLALLPFLRNQPVLWYAVAGHVVAVVVVSTLAALSLRVRD